MYWNDRVKHHVIMLCFISLGLLRARVRVWGGEIL